MTTEPYTLSNSEIQTFKRCRRKWWLTYYRRLQPREKSVVGPLALGSRLHKALEEFYRDGIDLQEAHAKLIEGDRITLMSMGHDAADLDSEAELGRIMLEGYADWVANEGLDADLTVVSAEEILQVPMLDGRVVLQGKLDLRVQNTHDRAHSALDFKHQPLDELVLTPEGWRQIGDLEAGDYVFGSQWTPVKVLDAFPPSEQPIFRLSYGNDRRVRASGTHEWPTLGERPNTSTWSLHNHNFHHHHKPIRLRPVLPDVNEEYVPERADWAYTVGWWIADGPVRPETDDSPLADLGLHRLPTNKRFIPTELITALGLYERLRLLQGICDSIGRYIDLSKDAAPYANYTKRERKAKVLFLALPNDRIARDVILLVASLGGYADVFAGDQDPFVVAIEFLPFSPFRRAPERETVNDINYGEENSSSYLGRFEKSEFLGMQQARCIRVDAEDGLYVTRHGLLTHNTSANFADYSALSHMDEQGLTYLTLDRIHTPEEHRIDGFILRLLRKVKRSGNARPPFYEQIVVRHNVFTLRNFWLRLNGILRNIIDTKEALDRGVDPMLVVYPTPNRNCRFDCNFVKICPLFDDGGGAEDALGDMFEETDPYAYYHDEKGSS